MFSFWPASCTVLAPQLTAVRFERMYIGSNLLCGGTQTGLAHLGRFQVVAVHGDRFRYNPALVIRYSVNVHLESGYKYYTRHFLLLQAKESPVILRSRVISEDHGSGSRPGLHDQSFPVRAVIIPLTSVGAGVGNMSAYEELQRLSVDSRKLAQLNHIHPPFPRFNLRHKRLWTINFPSDFHLCKRSFESGLFKPLQKG
jgi:hypothetical protein